MTERKKKEERTEEERKREEKKEDGKKRKERKRQGEKGRRIICNNNIKNSFLHFCSLLYSYPRQSIPFLPLSQKTLIKEE